jgi:hypothetical protein
VPGPAANPLRADRRGLGSVAALEYEIEKIPDVRIRRFFGAYDLPEFRG